MEVRPAQCAAVVLCGIIQWLFAFGEMLSSVNFISEPIELLFKITGDGLFLDCFNLTGTHASSNSHGYRTLYCG